MATTQIRGSSQIKSGTILNAQVASNAAIALTKLATVTASKILVSDGDGYITAGALSGGDISFDGTDLNLRSGVIVNADISSSAAIATSKLADGASFFFKDGSVLATGNFNLNSNKITNLSNATSSGDAVNKGQLDAAIAAAVNGLDVKASCRVATTENITLSGAQTIDGVSVVAGERVLVKNQTDAAENGIYVAASGSWSRSSDADSSAEVTAGLFTFIAEGSTNGDTGWYLITDDTITLGTTELTFTQFTGTGTITAGAGLTKTGNTIDVVSGNGGIVVNANDITFTVDSTADSLAVTGDGVKLKDGTSAQIYVANGSGVFKRVSVSGDITIGNDGVTAIGSGVIVNADISNSAAIALSKLATGTAGYIVLCNGSGVPTYTEVTGDVTINSSGVTAIANGVIVNADINGSAAIALSKLATGTAGYIIVCNGSGVPTYVEMTGDATIDTSGVVTVTGGITSSSFKKDDLTSSVNGSETNFTLTSAPVSASLQVFLNGILQRVGSGNDYTVSGTTLTMESAPASGDVLVCHYVA